MTVHASLISELESAIQGGSHDKRVDTLRRVTDLFLNGAAGLNEDQIRIFDDVLCHLIKRIETRAIVQLSERLAPIENAPVEVIRQLALNDEVVVAAPVLIQSKRLTAFDLAEVARTKGRGHLLAISSRDHLEEMVTDVLLSRDDCEVTHKLANNPGARFSETGFATLVTSAETDDGLAKRLGLRLDLPPRLLRALLMRATETVRAWLLAHAPSNARDEIQRALTGIANQVSREATATRDYANAQRQVLHLAQNGQLNEAALQGFIDAHRYEEIVVALASMSNASIPIVSALMTSPRSDGLLIACKSAGLKWPTVKAILRTRFAHHLVQEEELEAAKADYIILSHASAHRTLRFWMVRAGDKPQPEALGVPDMPTMQLRRLPPKSDRIKL